MTADDEVSISILKTVAQARLGAALGELPPNPELRSALAIAFDDAALMPSSEGDLARTALDTPEF